jgi:hypothetical protein
MPHDGKKLRPVGAAPETEYPSYLGYRDERRKVLRWLGAGGVAVAAGGLMGCDTVLGALGLARPPAQLDGEIACPTTPTPVPVTGDDDSAQPEVRHTRGEMVAPDPPTPETGTGADLSTLHEPETHLAGGPRVAHPEALPPGEPPMPEPTPSEARPEAHVKGDVAVADPPVEASVQAHPEGKLRGRIKMPETDGK